MDGDKVIPAGRWRPLAYAAGCVITAGWLIVLVWHELRPALAGRPLEDPRFIDIAIAAAALIVFGIGILRAGLRATREIRIGETQIAVGDRWAKWTSLGQFAYLSGANVLEAAVVGRDADPESLRLGKFRFGGMFHSARTLAGVLEDTNTAQVRALRWAGRPLQPAPAAPPAAPAEREPAASVISPSPTSGAVCAVELLALAVGNVAGALLTRGAGMPFARSVPACVIAATLLAGWFLGSRPRRPARAAMVTGGALYYVAVYAAASVLAHVPLAPGGMWASGAWRAPWAIVALVPVLTWEAMRRIGGWKSVMPASASA